jgi:hypothetical protein
MAKRLLADMTFSRTISFSCREKGAERSGQRERVTSPETMSLARGLGTAQVPKKKSG